MVIDRHDRERGTVGHEPDSVESKKALSGNRDAWFVFGALLVGCVLLFMNLGNHYLWQDEAQTALVSQTILDRGMPYGTDGRNYFSQEYGAEYGPHHIWRWHTWLSFYCVAASYKLFGVNTLASRLPFALFGLLTIPALYYFSKRLWPGRAVGYYSVILLLTCVPFLILSRECRWYSPAMFFSLVGLYAYAGLLSDKKYSMPLLVTSAVLLFNTHYIFCATLLGSLCIHGLIMERRRLRPVILACFLVTLLCSPWIVWFLGIRYQEVYGAKFLNPVHAFKQAIWYLVHIFDYLIPAFLFLIPVGFWIYKLYVEGISQDDREELSGRPVWIPIVFILVTVTVLSLTSPGLFLRYIVTLIPPLMMVAGYLITRVHEVQRVLAAGVLLAAVALQPLPDFLYELTHNYDGPMEGIAKFLNSHARPEDTVAISYGDMPLKFYTRLRVLGGLTAEDPAPAKTARWVIFRKNVTGPRDYKVRRLLRDRVDLSGYDKIVLPYPDAPFENRETPCRHMYRTAWEYEPVLVYRRRIQ